MKDRRPVSVINRFSAMCDKIVSVRMMTHPNIDKAVHRSQHALRRAVPCGVQVAVVFALANHAAAEDAAKFTPAFQPPGTLPAPLNATSSPLMNRTVR